MNIKSGRRERGAAWLNAASALVAESLTVTARSVRDPYHILIRKWKAKVAAEEKESGGGDKHMTEVEVSLEELQELESESEKVAEQQNEAKKVAAYFPKPIFTTTPPTVLWNFHNGSVLASDFMSIQAFFITNLKCKGSCTDETNATHDCKIIFTLL